MTTTTTSTTAKAVSTTSTTTSPTTTTAPPPRPTSGSILFADDFEGFASGRTWADGKTYGNWVNEFTGFGWAGIDVDGSKVLAAAPQPSTDPGETHASLVRSVPAFGDVDVTVRMKTAQQLRTPTPNAWETAWFLWHYTDNTHFYYLALKPNGWELGKEDPAYPGAQRFLRTGSSPSFPIGEWNTVRVVHVGNTMTVYANGTALTSFTDTERPYTGGSVALYNEDSEMHFDDMVVRLP